MKLTLPRPGDDVAPAKQALREQLRAARDDLQIDRRAAAVAAATLVAALEPVAKAKMVGLYASMGSELDTEPLAATLLSRGVALAFPRVITGQRQLVFHRARDLSELKPAAFGIPEPEATAPVVAVPNIDVFVIPGLAFDPTGNRLGWGKGHYDSTLIAHHRAQRVGFAFADQIVKSVPHDHNDSPMNYVVTPERVYVCRRPTLQT